MRVREKYRHSGAGDTGARASRPPAAGRLARRYRLCSLQAVSMKLPVAGLVSLFAATVAAAQLNPTVQRLPRPSGPVPPECERGLLPAAAPRIDVGEMQEPQVPAAVAASTPPATRS